MKPVDRLAPRWRLRRVGGVELAVVICAFFGVSTVAAQSSGATASQPSASPPSRSSSPAASQSIGASSGASNGATATQPRALVIVPPAGAVTSRPAVASAPLAAPAPSSAPETSRQSNPRTVRRPAAVSEEGVRWQKLKPAQRDVLQPLQQEWPTIDPRRKQKWIELADRLRTMPPDERARVQERMADWARLTPSERGQARLHFEQAKQTPLPARRTLWEAYQALPDEQKKELAAKAAAAHATSIAHRSAALGRHADHGEKAAATGASQGKSNLIQKPTFSAAPRPIGPTVIQAAPGATTTLITRRAAPPPHQHVGLPKIAATPEFVNKSTLLPRRGAQGMPVAPGAPRSPGAPGAAIAPVGNDAAANPAAPRAALSAAPGASTTSAASAPR